MNNNKKKVLALILIAIILALAGLAIFITIQLQKAQVPTAPTSRPRAAEWYGSESCNLNFAVATPTCPLQPPTGIRHDAPACIKVGETRNVTISWNTVQQSITDYRFRLDFNSPSWGGGGCQTLNDRDVCLDSPETSRTLVLGPGIYDAWVHTNGECISEPVHLNFEIGTCGVVPTPTGSPTGTGTPTATATPTAAPTGTSAPTTMTVTAAVTVTAGATAAPTGARLPEAGILNLPGVAAFGGGLLLTILGILFAL